MAGESTETHSFNGTKLSGLTCVTGVPKGEERVIRSEVILRGKNEVFQIDEDNP